VIVCKNTKVNVFRKAFGATLLPQTGSNVLPLGAPPEIIGIPDISSEANWYVLKTDGAVGPFIFQDREPIEFKQLAEGSTEEFMREKYYYGVRARYRMTYGDWRKAYAVTMTT